MSEQTTQPESNLQPQSQPNEIENYKGYSITADGERLNLTSPSGRMLEYHPMTLAMAHEVIDTQERRAEMLIRALAHHEAAMADAAERTAAERKRANARKMGRHENNADDLI